MISREKRLIITFRCTTDAIAMEKACKAAQAPGRLIPVPRAISASCGLSWCAAWQNSYEIFHLCPYQTGSSPGNHPLL